MTFRSDLVTLCQSVLDANSVFADEAPSYDALPNLEVFIDDSAVPELAGDARTMAWRQSAELNLREFRNASDGTLMRSLRDALDGVRITDGRIRVDSITRLPDDIHDAILWTIDLHIVDLR